MTWTSTRANNAASPRPSRTRNERRSRNPFQDFHAGRPARREGLVVGGMGPDEVINGRAGGGLTASFSQNPEPFPNSTETPHARDEARARALSQ